VRGAPRQAALGLQRRQAQSVSRRSNQPSLRSPSVSVREIPAVRRAPAHTHGQAQPRALPPKQKCAGPGMTTSDSRVLGTGHRALAVRRHPSTLLPAPPPGLLVRECRFTQAAASAAKDVKPGARHTRNPHGAAARPAPDAAYISLGLPPPARALPPALRAVGPGPIGKKGARCHSADSKGSALCPHAQRGHTGRAGGSTDTGLGAAGSVATAGCRRPSPSRALAEAGAHLRAEQSWPFSKKRLQKGT